MAAALGELVGFLFGFARSFYSTTHFVICTIVCRFMVLLCEELYSKAGKSELHCIRGKTFQLKSYLLNEDS